MLAVLAAVVAVSALPGGSIAPALSSAAQESPANGEEVIVVLEDGADPIATAQELGVEPTQIYDEVFTGFAATMPAEALAEASASGTVEQISRDGRVQAEAQVVGTGVLRVGVPPTAGSQHLDIASPIDADIAILDTGITAAGDLNVAGGQSCVTATQEQGKKDKNKKNKKKKGNKHKGKKGKQSKNKKNKKNKKNNKRKKNGNKEATSGSSWADDNGHGTHVAGIAAAIDNDRGIVGVAPGARVWAVKVLAADGGGSFSDVICGLDWVVANRNTIDVVNLSLSGQGSDGPCESSPLHQAICNVVESGITVVVAAGNQGTDASTRVPANFDEVITVSAMADSDGAPGHDGLATCSGQGDDTFFPFSNYGPDIDIAAPGDCIASLWKDGTIRLESGTSAASPHVAGAVALFIQINGSRPDPVDVRKWLLTEASEPQDSDVGFSGDPDPDQPDDIHERMLWLANATGRLITS
jgi:subtilisin